MRSRRPVRACRELPSWSGTELKKGAQSSVKVVGEGMKAGGEEVKKWFHDIGDGIRDVERKL